MQMYEFEEQLLKEGFKLIAGTDEAGRGPLAGPVFAGAVILDPAYEIVGLDDSKKLSADVRTYLAGEIKKHAIAYAVAMVSEAVIDKVNIYQASRIAMMDAIGKCRIKPDYVLSDAMPLPDVGVPWLAIVKGDAKSASIAAASIMAKTARDEYMAKMDEKYPGYGFEHNMGYPTKEHLKALEILGVTPIHRKTYRPIREILEKQISFDFPEAKK